MSATFAVAALLSFAVGLVFVACCAAFPTRPRECQPDKPTARDFERARLRPVEPVTDTALPLSEAVRVNREFAALVEPLRSELPQGGTSA